MYCHPIGKLPFEFRDSQKDWFWLSIDWIKRYIEFTCDKPLSGYYVEASEETEFSEITDEVLPNDEECRIPKAVSVFYEDGAEDDYEPYYNKCAVAYEKLISHIQWEQLNPYLLKSFFDCAAQYEKIPIENKIPKKQTFTDDPPSKINQMYEIIGLLPPSVIHRSEWDYFVIKLFMDYWNFFFSDTDSYSLCIHHTFYEGCVEKDYKTWKMPEGLALSWKIRKEDVFQQSLEMSKITWATFLTKFDWAKIDGVSLREYFQKGGYNNYLL
jgi:hypothetical protein